MAGSLVKSALDSLSSNALTLNLGFEFKASIIRLYASSSVLEFKAMYSFFLVFTKFPTPLPIQLLIFLNTIVLPSTSPFNNIRVGSYSTLTSLYIVSTRFSFFNASINDPRSYIVKAYPPPPIHRITLSY